jgi:branched-subunit amino acid transport protein
MSELIMLICGVAGTYAWRALGVTFSARIEPESKLFRWVSCVSYAMLAGLISRMTIIPVGSLDETSIGLRLGAMAVALAAFFLAGRSMLFGVVAGVATFIALVAFA